MGAVILSLIVCLRAHHVLTHSCPTRRSSDRLTRARFAPGGAAGHRRPADGPSRAMKEIGMTTRRMAIVAGVAVLLAIAIALATCSGNPGPDGESAQAAAAGSGAADDAAARGTADAKGAFELTPRSEEHTSELQSLMRRSHAVFCLKNTN